MNILAVDIGNSDIKYGLFVDGRLKRFWRASDFGPLDQAVHAQYKDPEVFSATFRNGLAPVGNVFDGMVYCSVVPEIDYALKKTIQFCFQFKNPPVAINPQKTPLPIQVTRYPLEQLGMDRLMAACGAHLMYPDQNILVVDFGTATTFGVLNKAGEFLGGLIAPGIHSFSNSLAQNTSLLPPMTFGHFARTIGENTVECLSAGVTLGYIGLVRELLHQVRQSLHDDYQMDEYLRLATGGGAAAFINTHRHFYPDDTLFDAVEETMTIKGLYAIYANMNSFAPPPVTAAASPS